MTWALATIAVLLIGYATVSRRLERLNVSGAMFFTTTGLLVGPVLGLLELEVHSEQVKLPGLKGPSQHRVIGKRTVAGSIAWLGRGDGCGWLSSRRLARRAGRSGDNHPRGRRFPGSLERVSLVQRAVQRATVRCSSSTSAGVFHPSVLRGLVLSASATAARSSAL